MVSLQEAVVARYQLKGKRFEILVQPELALKYRSGELAQLPELDELLAAQDVFSDSSKGIRASREDLIQVFGTHQLEQVIAQILRKGELQLTTQQRRELIQRKKQQLVDFLARNAINPQTNSPHPPARIAAALDQARFSLDPAKPLEQLVEAALKALRPILPIAIQEVLFELKLPPELAHRSHEFSRLGELISQDWDPDGSWMAKLRIPAGLVQQLYELASRIAGDRASLRRIS